MRRILILISAQFLLSLLGTYLISSMSIIGRLGVATFYKEYKWLRSSWKVFLLFFGMQLVIILLLRFVRKKYASRRVIYTASALLILGALGLLITYDDFLHTYSHRLLKERLHLGFYLFWIGWMGTCIFFLATGRDKGPSEGGPENVEIAFYKEEEI